MAEDSSVVLGSVTSVVLDGSVGLDDVCAEDGKGENVGEVASVEDGGGEVMSVEDGDGEGVGVTGFNTFADDSQLPL